MVLSLNAGVELARMKGPLHLITMLPVCCTRPRSRYQCKAKTLGLALALPFYQLSRWCWCWRRTPRRLRLRSACSSSDLCPLLALTFDILLSLAAVAQPAPASSVICASSLRLRDVQGPMSLWNPTKSDSCGGAYQGEDGISAYNIAALLIPDDIRFPPLPARSVIVKEVEHRRKCLFRTPRVPPPSCCLRKDTLESICSGPGEELLLR
ncbi:hypothetical protein MSAN_00322700 [Mycena sanguinolenta]|uniref:Uncharacterized protein n=1 Tax=Mycena sanguinolenta TaxID=230812 RepID=A0A8H6ZB68_9AGAR|nr:hypothetical protein MSAN_00322700 [Mycena sanguinolenta]